MLINILSYFRSKSFWIITSLYIIIIVYMKIGFFSSYIKYGISVETYLFSEYTALIMIGNLNCKIDALNTFILLFLPTLVYYIYILISFYHYSFEVDSAFLFLRLSRKKKVITYIIETFIMFTTVFTILTLYQLIIMGIKYDLVYNYHVLIINYINTVFFYFLLYLIMFNLVILIGDWKGNVISLFTFVFISAGNLIYNYNYILKQKRLIKQEILNIPIEDVLNRINQKVFNPYIPTQINILYYNSLIYSLVNIFMITILSFLAILLFDKIDINKEVVQ